jgi:hypothetical protein
MAQGVRNLGRQGRGSSGPVPRFGFARMMRDVLVASIYRGQFPPALIGLIILAIVLKMPAADVSKVMLHFMDLLERHELLGYLLATLCATGWFLHARSQRRRIGEERRRLNSEREALNAMMSGGLNRASEVQS